MKFLHEFVHHPTNGFMQPYCKIIIGGHIKLSDNKTINYIELDSVPELNCDCNNKVFYKSPTDIKVGYVKHHTFCNVHETDFLIMYDDSIIDEIIDYLRSNYK